MVVAGTGLTFGMWWIYFAVPAADLLHAHRERSFPFGYLHILLFGAIVATGAGLHAAAYYVEHHSELGSVGTVLSVVFPVAAYIASSICCTRCWCGPGTCSTCCWWCSPRRCCAPRCGWPTPGVPMTVCLLIATLAPVVSVVGFEMVGHRHAAAAIAACRQATSSAFSRIRSGKPTNGSSRFRTRLTAGHEGGTRGRDASFGVYRCVR